MATTSTTYFVAGMTCGHCVAAVTKEVSKIDGVVGVDVDLATGAVIVASTTVLDPRSFAEAVDEAGYEVVS